MKAPLMPGSLYIFSFDTQEWAADIQRLNDAFDDQVEVEAWWNYIPGLYIYRSTPNNVELMKRMRTFAGRRTCLVVEVGTPEAIIGNLPVTAWTWFYDIPEHIKLGMQEQAAKRVSERKIVKKGDHLGGADV